MVGELRAAHCRDNLLYYSRARKGRWHRKIRKWGPVEQFNL
jgi:hypothetical protein